MPALSSLQRAGFTPENGRAFGPPLPRPLVLAGGTQDSGWAHAGTARRRTDARIRRDHRPGPAIDATTGRPRADLHDAFVEALRDTGVIVHYFGPLLGESH